MIVLDFWSAFSVTRLEFIEYSMNRGLAKDSKITHSSQLGFFLIFQFFLKLFFQNH
jgi:hypothetical protein